ncbi:hypothetical protein [Actinospica robiniae]|uniref:hypothetical protein n=1 Tax=Actinospica robiniae TaxID=304901 RepID=UPI0005516B1B|nr:hypothetical protein [Actinospica robiniae]
MARSGADGGARGSTRARNQVRQLPILVATLLAFFAVMEHVTSGDPSRFAGCVAAYGVALATLVLRPFAVMLVMVCLGSRVARLHVGFGPFLGVRVVRHHVVTLRTVPLAFTASYRPPPWRWARDVRIMYAATLLSLLALNLVGMAVVPPYARVLCPIFGLGYCASAAVSRSKGSPRTMWARAFSKPTLKNDPQLANPHWGYAADGMTAARFGDFAEAATDLQYLRNAGSELGDGIEVLLQQAQGDYPSVARAYSRQLDGKTPVPAAVRSVLMARLAFVTLLVAEQEPARQDRAVAYVDQHLELRGAAATSPDTLPAAALRALLDGDTARCLNLTRRQLAGASHPMEIADALCTSARAHAAAGRGEKAFETIHRAIGIAPWYARVGIVQQLLGAEPSPTDLSAALPPAEVSLFDDPWSTSEA